ncbi:betaine/proline/choline family ABC transporter ATP-binding protein [Desulforhopalus vacuolatus]|uniref:betaine/proline/choline family ABC transporter ATP-binding protein n=1 Tax=Desulforhopalus vacuolatus TaxID=40414 RepID=UPI0019659A88|nr:betaine/proline/choline family ABC transporter ATP-binding protein [Desulforhopalus vacuolatus]MBM9519175.1 betaine/proline/choline family ABC transporter ATP-binding protein [Desulforhopalus vacuolatus]
MIELVDLVKSYDGVTNVVDGLNLTINSGELVVLIGSSGSGKSTILRMINRLNSITGGDILIDGESIQKKNPIELRRGIGYVIQKVGLMPHMTVGENIEMVPKLLGWDKKTRRKQAMAMLARVDLPAKEYYPRYPGELSGGQQQRIGVARALAVNPEVILMDEPFSALDPITREQLQQEILALQDELHKTIVFVTHDMDEALKIADRIALLKDGEIVQYSTPEELLRNPVNEYVREFVGNDRLWQTPEFLYARDIMRTNVTRISMKRTAAQAIEMMKDKDTYVGYVIDTESRPAKRFRGEVSMQQLKNARGRKMAEIMNPDAVFVYDHTNMAEVLSLMQEQNYKRVPVLNRDHCVVGYINRSALLNIITDVMPSAGSDDPVELTAETITEAA